MATTPYLSVPILGSGPTGTSANSTKSSIVIDLQSLDGMSVDVIFPAATSLDGYISFLFTNYAFGVTGGNYSSIPAYAWSRSPVFGDFAIPTAQTGPISFPLDLHPISHRFLQVVWNYVDGSGSILIVANGKSWGG